MNNQLGYFRFPTLQGDRIVFVCEDDLWSVAAAGGIAIRLTANLGEVTRPFLSPDGQHLAFVGREEGHSEVYCMPAAGGTAKRLTFLGKGTAVQGWSQTGEAIVFSSGTAQPFRHLSQLYQISPEGGLPEPLPLGMANAVSYGANGGVVIGRNMGEPARWKRYRGGRAGVLWIDPTGSSTFQKLIDLNGNLAAPMWIGDRIYFISDHEGIGSLYSCTPTGQDLQPLIRHAESDHADYYIRNATTDGSRIVYQAGADLFYIDPGAADGTSHQTSSKIDIQFHSPRVQRQRKFVEADEYLEDYDLHPDGHSTLITTRGKSYSFGHWEGAVTQLGLPEAGRYRLTRWLNDRQRLVTLSDRAGVEKLEIFTPGQAGSAALPEVLELDLGRAKAIAVSPTADEILLSNHRHELIWVNLATQESRVLDRSDYHRIHGFCWSPDGRWAAYSCAETQSTFSIKLCNIATGDRYCLTPPRFRDVRPAFDPGGKFIYFLSVREFNPVYDSIYFDLGFPKGMRPFLISLQQDTPSPFVSVPKPLNGANGKADAKTNGKPDGDEASESKAAEPKSQEDAVEDPVKPIAIDFEGIEHRIIGFPVAEGRYQQIWGLEGKVLFSSFPVQGALDWKLPHYKREAKGTLEIYDFDTQKQEVLTHNLSTFKVGRDHKTLIYRSHHRLRVCTTDPKDRDKAKDNEPSRKSGWLDLNRVRVSVTPAQEWSQMLREIWRLQQEHFWTADLSGVDWQRVYDRYSPLLDRISTRSEFSDLVWEMQGELGTSHAYESGGDYRDEPDYRLGFLGADFCYEPEADAYRITQIVRGDAWSDQNSPLNQLGVNLQPGDLLLAINGQRVGQHLSPSELLVHQAHCEVELTVAAGAAAGETPTRENPAPSRTVTVRTLRSETALRYRQWVERNHHLVATATQGQVGYLHIPDMSAVGYAEFHRYYFAEVSKAALIVDVRYNGGGHVSQLILEKLARQRIGYDISRWGKPDPYPGDSIAGPLVALTNEHAGSDGDIFSHCFKLMNLGKLIGKRTWGGVIGISPSHRLVDRSVVTQPEYSFWFQDVGWGVENYGTDPDIEVDITPQDWVKNKDPQLEKAIQVILDQLAQNPVKLPDFSDRPHLPLPE